MRLKGTFFSLEKMSSQVAGYLVRGLKMFHDQGLGGQRKNKSSLNMYECVSASCREGEGISGKAKAEGHTHHVPGKQMLSKFYPFGVIQSENHLV